MKQPLTPFLLLAAGWLLGAPATQAQVAPAATRNGRALPPGTSPLRPAATPLNEAPTKRLALTRPGGPRDQARTSSTETVTQAEVGVFRVALDPLFMVRDRVVDAAGNTYVTGSTTSAAGIGSDVITAKFAPSGQLLWQQRFDSFPTMRSVDEARALAVDAAGNVLVTGSTSVLIPSTNQVIQNFLTIAYSPGGTVRWSAQYGQGDNLERAADVAVDAAGNVLVTGTSTTTFTGRDYEAVTVKYSPTGQQLWATARTNTSPLAEEARQVVVDANGDVVARGERLLRKYAGATGQLLWVGRSAEPIYSMAVDPTGQVLTASNAANDYVTVKYASTTGQRLWEARYDGGSFDELAALAVDAGGNVVVTGTSSQTSTGQDYATVKYGPGGQQLWVARYNSATNGADAATALVLDAAGNVYVTGRSRGSAGDNDFRTLKYSPTGQQVWEIGYRGPNNSDDVATTINLASSGSQLYVSGSSGTDIAVVKYVQTSIPNQAPVANAGPNQTITLPTSSAPLSGAGTDADGSIAGYRWTQVSGPNPATFSSLTEPAPTVSGLVAGTYVFSLVVTDNEGLPSAASQTTLTVNPATPAAGTPLYRIHAGGEQVTTSLGAFAADQYAVGGSVFATDQPIAGTEDDALYQTERYGNAFSYAFPVSRGQQYQVVLHFAEIYATQPGQRVFDVAAEGTKVLDNYDIYGKVGAFVATTERFTVTVTDDELNLAFSALASEGGVDNAKVAAIEIYRLNATPTAVLRLNAGGGQLTTSTGPFTADQYAAGGAVFSTDQAIANTADDALYQTERYGTFTYNLPVPNGQYTVKLHFAELYWNTAGQRVFDVAAEGSPVLSAYDIAKKVGPLTATTETFPVTVTDGQLTLAFAPGAGGVDQPKVAAIEVLAAAPTAVLRLKAGGDALNTSFGRFAADQYFAGGRDFATNQPIAGTEDDALYQTERYGSFLYSLPVPNGTYTVKLHFAELYWSAPGQRVFNVTAENTTVLQAYDIVRKVGPLTATTESFSVTVTDGVLSLAFAPGATGVDQPKVSAIEVLSSGSAQPAPAARPAASPLAAGASAKLPVYSAQVKLYPNPSTDGRVTVELPAAFQGEVTYTLVSSLGTTLSQGQRTVTAGGQSLTFDFSPQLPAEGLYYLHLRGAKGQAHVKLLRK